LKGRNDFHEVLIVTYSLDASFRVDVGCCFTLVFFHTSWSFISLTSPSHHMGPYSIHISMPATTESNHWWGR